MFVDWLVLAGCGKGGDVDGSGSTPGVDEGPPALTIESPAPAAWVPAGPLAVYGAARGVSDLTLGGSTVSDGAAAAVGGRYQSVVTVPRGVTTLDLSAVDADGAVHQVVESVLAGEFASTDGRAERAIGIHLGQRALDGLGPLIAAQLDPAALLGAGAGTVVFQDSDYTVILEAITLDALNVAAVPTDGSLGLTIGLQGLSVSLSVETTILFIPVTLDADVRIADAALVTGIGLAADGAGGLASDVLEPALTFTDVEVDVDGVADFIEDLFLDDADAQELLESQLGAVTDALPALIDDALAGVTDALRVEFAVGGTTLTLDPFISSAGVTPDGVDLGIDLGILADGLPPAQFLVTGTPPAPTGDDLVVLLSDDLANRLLTLVWASGAIDASIPIEPGSLEGALLLLFGGTPQAGGALSLTAGLPPVLIDRDGVGRLQLGEWALGVDVPGGTWGDHLDLGLHADLNASMSIGADAVTVKLSDATFILSAPADADPGLVAQLPEMADGMEAGIGLLGGLLTFPIGGTTTGTGTGTGTTGTGTTGTGTAPGLGLPPLAIARDPSGRGTRLTIDLAGWTATP